MTCRLCENKGVIKIGYREEPIGWVDYGVCRCAAGQRFRSEQAMTALAAKYGTDREHVNLVEALLDPEDFPREFSIAPTVDVSEAGRVERRRKPRL